MVLKYNPHYITVCISQTKKGYHRYLDLCCIVLCKRWFTCLYCCWWSLRSFSRLGITRVYIGQPCLWLAEQGPENLASRDRFGRVRAPHSFSTPSLDLVLTHGLFTFLPLFATVPIYTAIGSAPRQFHEVTHCASMAFTVQSPPAQGNKMIKGFETILQGRSEQFLVSEICNIKRLEKKKKKKYERWACLESSPTSSHHDIEKAHYILKGLIYYC